MSVNWKAPPDLAEALAKGADAGVSMKHFAVVAMALAAAAAAMAVRRILARRRLDAARLAPVRRDAHPPPDQILVAEQVRGVTRDAALDARLAAIAESRQEKSG